MKKINFLLSFISVLFFAIACFFIFTPETMADYNYVVMEKIPGFENEMGNFPSYVLAFTKFGIWTVGIVALFMITFGGFMYMTAAGNTSRMDTAKTVIFDAFYGLIVALAAWLLLFVINPDLVKVTLTFQPVTAPRAPTSPTPPSGPSGPPSGIITWPTAGLSPLDSALRTQLAAAGISVNKANCTYVGQSGCTSLDGLPQSTVDRLIALQPQIGAFTITGGTEYWLHSSHGPGRPVVDIWPSAPRSQWDSIVNTLLSQGATRAFCDVSGQVVSCTNPSAHIHVRF